ncbi:MAG: hypothetical protein ACOZF2_17410 [Thermodesulfobacteriota bacterium]
MTKTRQVLQVSAFLSAAVVFLASGFMTAGARTPTREQVFKAKMQGSINLELK